MALAARRLFENRFVAQGLSNIRRRKRWGCYETVKRFSDSTIDVDHQKDDEKSRNDDVAVDDRKSKGLSPTRRGRKGLLRRWRNDTLDDHDYGLVPSLYGFGHAIAQAAENVNQLLKNLSHRVKEHDERYVLHFPVPGLAKEDVKVTIEDGVLVIKGEHKEDTEEGTDDDDQFVGFHNYQYYDTKLVLPDDAKADGIKAELKMVCLVSPFREVGRRSKMLKRFKLIEVLKLCFHVKL